jgi:F-type H+-transporting ATPase subunit gamma
MKSLSAHHFREARRAVEPARTYREAVARILDWAGAGLAAGEGEAGLLVIGAELGLCGGYNARLAEAGRQVREELGPGPTFCVGRRAATLLARHEVDIERVHEGPTSVGGITRLLLELAEEILTTFATRRLSSFDIVSSRFGGVGSAAPEKVRLLPVEPRASETGPRVRYVRPDELASATIREFLYITLYDLLLDALASEHGARLIATQAAEKWLDERTDRLHRHLMATRREASTQEMIEISSGARARARRL